MNRIHELEVLITRHKALYYQGRPEIADYLYDQLEDELKKLDPENATLLLVGSSMTNQEKVKHDKKMLSLDKTYAVDDLLKFKGEEDLLSTFKLDGMSCSLVYEHGHLVLAKTRGDGLYGENITDKVRWITAIPKWITLKNKIEIRGELYCQENKFFHLSEEMHSLNLERPTNQRNIVAGLMGRKDNVELCRYIDFMAFDYIEDKKSLLNNESEKYQALAALGFIIPEILIHKNAESITEAIDSAREFMASGEYQIDGLVFTYNRLSLHEELGETAHHPRFKMAFKFLGQSKSTLINEIVWSVSRQGILTPVAEVVPVELSGAMISRVTLHNYGLVKEFSLKKGDTIEIIRSGEVIPKFLRVIDSGHGPLEIPEMCPSCRSPVVEKEIRLFCSNDSCPGKNKESILNFIQKIEIYDLSEKRLDELLAKGLVKKMTDLYRLTVEDFLTLDKVQDKLAQKLIENISKTKKIEFQKFLAALGISGGALNKCEKIVSAGFDSPSKVKQLSINDLMAIESFAEKSAKDFHQSLEEKISLIDEFVDLGMEFVVEEKKQTTVTGKKLCITGALSEKRSVIENWIRECGGIIVSSVSKNTDYLVTNEQDHTSSKFKKALELKIKIISEKELLVMIQKE